MLAPAAPPLRSHTPKGSAARARVLRAAEKLLVSGGFHGTSMRDVAEGAGLPLATIVYHFARKEQLYASVLEVIGAQLEGDMARALGDDGSPWPRRLDALVRALVEWTETNPGRVKLLLRELLDNESRVARASRLPLAPVLLRLSAFVEDGMRAGAFRRVVAETSVLHLVGAVSYFVAARPTVRRIVGPTRDRRLTASYEREALELARRMFLALEPEVHLHGSEDTDHAGEPRARSRRGTHHGRGRSADPPPRRHLPR